MKVIILDTLYKGFLSDVINKNKLIVRDDDSFRKHIFECHFGTSDAYSFYLDKLGVSAKEMICNSPIFLPFKNENVLNFVFNSSVLYQSFKMLKFFENFALTVLKSEKPDVVHCQDIHFFSHSFYKEVRSCCKLLVGQLAAPLPSEKKLSVFHLLLSSLPNFVEHFQNLGISSELFPLGFDPRVGSKLKPSYREFDVTFVGGLGRHHSDWIHFLELIAEHTDLRLFGYGYENIPKSSILRSRHCGPAWGIDMYEVLAKSKITLNRHISISKQYANNMRLYEATGVGAMLLTDNKINLGEIFSVGSEIVTYSSASDAVEKIHFYLKNGDKRESIAKRGQCATLERHSYESRMVALKEIYERYV